MRKLGIYVHVPFCESKCAYCNFISFKSDEETKEKYVFALIKEMEMYKETLKDCVIDTIFFGGGTPSCLRPKAVKNILNYITNNFNVESDAEITIECNPNSITREKLSEYKLAGVNRLSIGLQAYNNKLLKLIGRIHTIDDFDRAIKNAKSMGFENINVDLLLGLPKQKMYDVVFELKHLFKLNIPHFSCYGLIVEENTKLCRDLENKVYSLPSEENSVKMYNYTLNFLKKHGIFRYEVSNFAKKGFESKHNLKYWTMQEYVGFGLASHSFFDNERWENASKLDEYFTLIESGQLPRIALEKETNESLKEEFLMTGLRKQSGISLDEFEKMFNEDLLISKQNEISKLFDEQLVDIKDGRLLATDKGFEFLNQIILNLA